MRSIRTANHPPAETKKCRRCRETKSGHEFYRNKFMASGLGTYCKKCNGILAGNWQKRNPERHRVGNRIWWNNNVEKVRHINNRAKWRQRRQHPEYFRAWGLVFEAVKSGKLIAQPCGQCGVPPEKSQAHHDDYSKPLQVRWLCDPCHRAHHKRLRRIREVA